MQAVKNGSAGQPSRLLSSRWLCGAATVCLVCLAAKARPALDSRAHPAAAAGGLVLDGAVGGGAAPDHCNPMRCKKWAQVNTSAKHGVHAKARSAHEWDGEVAQHTFCRHHVGGRGHLVQLHARLLRCQQAPGRPAAKPDGHWLSVADDRARPFQAGNTVIIYQRAITLREPAYHAHRLAAARLPPTCPPVRPD